MKCSADGGELATIARGSIWKLNQGILEGTRARRSAAKIVRQRAAGGQALLASHRDRDVIIYLQEMSGT